MSGEDAARRYMIYDICIEPWLGADEDGTKKVVASVTFVGEAVVPEQATGEEDPEMIRHGEPPA